MSFEGTFLIGSPKTVRDKILRSRSPLLVGPVRSLYGRYECGESFAIEAPGYSYAAAQIDTERTYMAYRAPDVLRRQPAR
jgi:hypothetical protein